jgi:hypothetical protein
MKPRARYRILVPAAKLSAEERQNIPGVVGIFYDIELLGVDQSHLHM